MNTLMNGKRRSVISRALWVFIWALPAGAWALLTLPVAAGAAASCDATCLTNTINTALGSSPGSGTGVSALGWFDPSTQIANIAAGWLPKAQSYAKNLFGWLFTIELFMLGLQTALFKDNLSEFFSSLTFKVFTAGFFLWLMNDANSSHSLFSTIISSFRQSGQDVSGASSGTLSKLYGEEAGAVMMFVIAMISALLASSAADNLCPVGGSGCTTAISMIAIPVAVLCGGMAILLFSSLLLVSLTYIMITIETMIVMCGGVFFLGFAGLRYTMPFSQGYLRYAINVGIKLYAFWLVVAINAQIMPGILANSGLAAGAAAPFGIAGVIAARAATSVVDTNLERTGEAEVVLAGRDTALALDETATRTEAGIETGAGMLVAGSGDATADAEVISAAPVQTRIAENSSDMATNPTSMTAGEAADAASIASTEPAVVAAATAAFLAIMFAAFGALQVIVLNALTSAIPKFAKSFTEGSSALSAQETLKALGGLVVEASVAAKAMGSAINKAFLSKTDSAAKVANDMQRREDPSAGNMTPIVGSEADAQATQLKAFPMNSERHPVAPQTGGQQLPSHKLPGQPPLGQQVAPAQQVGNPVWARNVVQMPPAQQVPQGQQGQQLPGQPPLQPAGSQGLGPPQTWQELAAQDQVLARREQRAQRSLDEFGFAGMTDAQRDSSSPIQRLQAMQHLVNGDHPLTPQVAEWIESNPDARRMWNRLKLEKRDAQARADSGRGIMQGVLLEAAFSASTQSGGDGGAGPTLGGSGINT